MPALKIIPVTGVSTQPADNEFALELKENITTSPQNPTVVGVLTGFLSQADRDHANFVPVLTGDDGGRFDLVRAQAAGPNGAWQAGDWIVVLKNSGPDYFDYENNVADNNFTYQSTGGPTYEVSIDVVVQDVNEGPHNIALTGGPVTSGTPGATVGTLSALDEDDIFSHQSGETQQITYTIDSGAEGNLFEIQNGGLKLKPGSSLDYNGAPHTDANGHYYEVIVRATDGGGYDPNTGLQDPLNDHNGGLVVQDITVDVNDVNEAPANITLTGGAKGDGTVDENSLSGTVVGILAATDPEGDQLTYKLLDSSSRKFKLVGNEIQVENGADLDFEAILTGGAGKDVFVFDTKPNKTTNVDHITDFVAADDTIHLNNAAGLFTKIGNGALKAGAFCLGTKAQDAEDRIIYNTKTGALYYDADGTGTKAAILFAVLDHRENTGKITYKVFFVL